MKNFFYEKVILGGTVKRDPFSNMRKHALSTAAVFPRGSKKRKCNDDDKHDHDRRKGDPQHYVEGKMENPKYA